MNVAFISLQEQLDTSSPIGQAMFTIIGAMAQLERDIIRERVVVGVARARAEGRRLGRPPLHRVDVVRALALRAEGRSLRAVARELGVHPMAVRRALGRASQIPPANAA
jgi:DNA invertase Pin-like site-specific DNA recombinase